MKDTPRTEYQAIILTPEPGDDPQDLEDVIHDHVRSGRREVSFGDRVVQVVLDLTGVEHVGPWMKAVGPEVPDVNLRVVLGPKDYVTARALKLDALFEWYADVESALRGGV